METLFKFSHIRPPIEPEKELVSIRLATTSAFQKKLKQAIEAANSRKKMKDAATQFVATAEFIKRADELHYADQLASLRQSLDALENLADVDNDAVNHEITESFSKKAAQVVAEPAFSKELINLRDSLVAIKLLPEEHRRPLHHLTDALRDMELIQRVADDADFPETGERLHKFRRRSVELPEGIALGSVLKGASRKPDDSAEERKKHFDAMLERFRGLLGAVEELTRIDGQKLEQSPVKASKGFLNPKNLRPITMLQNAISKGYSPYLSLNSGIDPNASVRANMTRAYTPDELANNAERGASVRVAGPLVMADKAPLMQRSAFVGRAALEPTKPLLRSFLMTSDAGKNLSKDTQTVLKERNLSVTAQPVDEVVNQLRTEVTSVGASLEQLADHGSKQSFKRIGKTMVMIKTPIATPWVMQNLGFIPNLMFPVPELILPDSRIPHSHGDVKPVGIADLLVVKQQLKRYEARDIAHIENVLQGESKVREHRRLNTTEELSFREVEKTTSEERDLESTDRFEMSRESSETLQEDAKLKAGMSISAKYGPAVEFSASVEGSYSRSKTQASKAASSFSKEVTQRSAQKISERVLERESRKVTTEVEETNTHTLNNVGGDGHVRGIYQWIEKVYEAQVYNYGLRTMFDFMVPEPGAFIIEALRRAHISAMEIEKPMAFNLRPDQITEYNYHTWISRYHATDVSPPPEPYITKTHDYNAGGGDDKTDYNHSTQIQIDDGYRAIFATVGAVGNVWDDSASIDVVIGQRTNRIEDAGVRMWRTSLDNEVGSVPFAMNTFQQSDIAIALEVKCQRTDRAVSKWRHETHAKLTVAYRARLAEYEEKLAALEAQAGIMIEGMSPSLNLEIMTDELKKACVSILTEQHYELFDAIENGSNGLPQIDLHENEAEGPYVRFFEQAFEWEQMTWLTYPYFWGRKSQWSDRIAMEDADPIFNQFLKAGYCRVVVPLRPGFEGAVDHFMNFGEPWMGGPLPPITSELYLPIVDEISERLDRPGDEIPEGDPWEVRFPTSLVRLRDDGSLPSWEKNGEGNWVPVGE
ncbi:MAG: hypothetical protein P1U67_10260 [Alcanivoracaceae bacterium]|nr:hypothetical protein [Alcanivoracaceae bacterium]